MALGPRWARFAIPLLACAVLAAACSGSGSDDGDAGGIEDDLDALADVDTSTPDADDPQSGDGVALPQNTSPVRDSSVYIVTPLDDDEAPFTGRRVADPSLLDRPVLTAKIDNVEAARPQAGLVEADLVFEEMVEGGISRFLTVYHSTDPGSLGPIRSARSTDIPLLMPMVTPLFAWSGANEVFADVLRSTAVVDVGVEAAGDLYSRRPDRTAPSDLFTDGAALRALTPEGALSTPPMFSFREEGAGPSPEARPVAGVDLDFGTTTVSYRWDEGLGGWRREQDGTAHVDDRGQPVAPANVIVQFVPYNDTGLEDANGAPVPEAQIIQGQGAIWFLSGGAALEGTWFKDNITVPFLYLDGNGERVLNARGTTWVALMPTGQATLVE